MPSMLSPSRSSVGINNTPFVDTWHGKPGVASLPLQCSAGRGASGWIAGLPSKPRSASACNRSVAVHWRTPCWFRVINELLQPRPTPPPTPRFSITLLGSAASLCHEGGEHGKKVVAITARVGGFGLALRKMEGGRCVCLFVFGLHRLLWQHRIYALGAGGTLPPTPHSCHSYSTCLPFLLC
jgi:hypothetical protein